MPMLTFCLGNPFHALFQYYSMLRLQLEKTISKLKFKSKKYSALFLFRIIINTVKILLCKFFNFK